jgi:enoyl-CoA hydratase/carnithine racemase
MTKTRSDDELIIEQDGDTLVLRINRPASRNALTRSLLLGLGEQLARAEVDESIRAVILTGTGDRAFCAGMDLAEFTAGDSTDAEEDDPRFATFQRFTGGELRVPVIGAANGAAVGGGFEILLGCDMVVAADTARFALPEVKRGLFSSGGGTFIASRIPVAVALELALTGDFIDADRAYQLGLVNCVAEGSEVLATAKDLARRVAANGPLAVRATKELVRLGSYDPQRARERYSHWLPIVFESEDAKEGAASFIEKRAPVWQGR